MNPVQIRAQAEIERRRRSANPEGGTRVLLNDLVIRTKDKRLVPFTPNTVQTLYLDDISQRHPEFQWRDGIYTLRGLRDDILKARQQGMSTLWLALYFLDTVNNPNTHTLIVAHDAESTERLFKIIQNFYKHLPTGKQPRTKYSSKRELEFRDTGSLISVGTAGSASVGRGSTLNNVHCSERAFWPDGDTVETGLLEAVPAEGNVTRETTANGLNGYHAERLLAENGESNFHPVFFAWFQEPTYRAPVPPGFERTDDEEKLATAYGLDDEQLQWRRVKRRQLRDKWPQEYPSNSKEAFLTSGNPYFDRAYLSELNDRIQSPEFDPLPASVVRDQLAGDAATLALNERLAGLKRLQRELGRDLATPSLQVWQLPQPGRTYILAADTAEGLNERGSHDFDSADVLDAETWEQVAHLHGRWDTSEYGLMLAELGFWYNTALLGIERNNHGHAVINAALHLGEYPAAKGDEARGLYFHQEYDENKKPLAKRPGWPTTARTKYFALDGLATSIESRDITIRCRQSVGELLTFVKLPGGKAGGEGKAHDDRVSSLAIGDALLKLRSRSSWESQLSALRARVIDD